MAHFAKLNDDNIVLEINVVNNDVLDPLNEEETGVKFLTQWSNGYSNWKQTSYTNSTRYNFAGVGYTYDPIDDAFIAPMPNCGHDELLLNDLKRWECSHVDHDIDLP
jgi:hypothetical protein